MPLVGRIHHCARLLPEPGEEIFEDRQVHACPTCKRTWIVRREHHIKGVLFNRGQETEYWWARYEGPVDEYEANG